MNPSRPQSQTTLPHPPLEDLTTRELYLWYKGLFEGAAKCLSDNTKAGLIMTEAGRMILECRVNMGTRKFEQYKPPIHGQDHDQKTAAWQLVLSIVEGLKDGSYTLPQVEMEAKTRLGQLASDPLSLKELRPPRRD